jgi:5-methylthioadenosine/S-adenosylhomocysteine deaminase
MDPIVGDLQRGDILIDGGKIAAISHSIPAEDAEIIDASNQIAIPGFIDTHRGTWESLLRATGPD